MESSSLPGLIVKVMVFFSIIINLFFSKDFSLETSLPGSPFCLSFSIMAPIAPENKSPMIYLFNSRPWFYSICENKHLKPGGKLPGW